MATGFVPVTIADLPEDGRECPICGVTYGESDDDGHIPPEEAVRLGCGNNHVFGRACITAWLTDTNVNGPARTCPTDRTVLFNDEQPAARGESLWLWEDPHEDESQEEALHFGVAQRVATMIRNEAGAYHIVDTFEMADRKMQALFSSAELGVSLRIDRLHQKSARYEATESIHLSRLETILRALDETRAVRSQLRSTIELFERCRQSRQTDNRSSHAEA